MEIVLLFRFFPGLHRVTYGTGMLSVESLDERLFEWGMFRVLDEHHRPPDRLKRAPVETDGRRKGEDSQNAADSSHELEYSLEKQRASIG